MYGVVQEHLETFLDQARKPDGDGYPRFVEKEFRRYVQSIVMPSWPPFSPWGGAQPTKRLRIILRLLAELAARRSICRPRGSASGARPAEGPIQWHRASGPNRRGRRFPSFARSRARATARPFGCRESLEGCSSHMNGDYVSEDIVDTPPPCICSRRAMT